MPFPNLRDKHAKDSIINPKEFAEYAKKQGKYTKRKPPKGVIICYNRDLMKHVLKSHKTTQVKSFFDKLYLLNETKNQIGIIGGFGIGSPVAGTVIEEIIAWGVKRFITLGTAGSLQKDLKVGGLAVCTRSIRDEGTSHHYLKPSKYAYPDPKMVNRIKKALDNHSKDYIEGSSWTIDAPYRETVAEARQYQKEGVLTVEMEASALFAIAQFRKVSIGALFTISDSLAELEWKPMFHSKKTKKSLEELYEIAKEVLLSRR